jgi:Xaa-Pro aminopeptidase
MPRRRLTFLLALTLATGACATAPAATRASAPATAPVPATVATPAQPAQAAAVAVQDPITHQEYAARRAELARRIGNGVFVAFGSPEPAADYLEFSQNAHFRYLTGINEPEARLVMTVTEGVAQSLLFVRERDYAREVWEGYRLGTARAAQVTGLPTVRVEEFASRVQASLAGATRVYIVEGEDVPDAYVSPAHQLSAELEARQGVTVVDGAAAVSQLRARKSPAELVAIRHAVDISVHGHAAVVRAIAPGQHEYAAEAALEHAFRSAGAERTAFSSIVGSGPNSTVLHYLVNDRLMQAGDVVVVDIGASWRGYAGDVTRTYPVSGRFTTEQREIYQIVRDAQAAAETAAVLGAPAGAMTAAAERVLAAGLARLGLIESPDATYDCSAGAGACRQFRLYYMHSLGHGIGLDVHDPGTAPNAASSNVPLAPGDAFSIEPGIYVRRHLLEVIPETPRNAQLKTRIRDAVARYGDIGVRIEDDYIVTAAGVEWISRAPREIAEIELPLTVTQP